MRVVAVRLAVGVAFGLMVVGTQTSFAKSNAKCESAVSAKRSAAERRVAAQASNPEKANAEKPVAKINPTLLLLELQSKVQISRKANDLGFNLSLNPTRTLTREEAMPIVSMMLQLKMSDVQKVVDDIAAIQLYGHFDHLNEIYTVLASAYHSKLEVKKFATNLALVQANLLIPNKNELGFQAQDLRSPDLQDAMMVFNIVLKNKGDGKAAQMEILEVAEFMNTGSMEVISAIIFQAQQQKASALQMAASVKAYSADLKLVKRVMGFGAANEVVRPSALEAVALVQIGSQLNLDSKAMAKVVEEIQIQTGSTDFSGILAALAEGLKPEDETASN